MVRCLRLAVLGVFFLAAVVSAHFGGVEENFAASDKERLVGAKAGLRLADIALKNTVGKSITLGDFMDQKALVVIFIGTECPVNNAYMRSLKELQAEFAEQEVKFLAINSNSQDSA